MEADDDVGETVFLALTRPPIMPLLGLPLILSLIFIVAAAETIMITQGFLALFGLSPFYIATRLWVRNDYNAVQVLLVSIRTKFRSIDVWRWGGGSLSPFPIKSKAPRGIA